MQQDKDLMPADDFTKKNDLLEKIAMKMGKKGNRSRLYISMVTVGLVFLLVCIALTPQQYNLKVGSVMPTTVFAYKKVEDKVATDQVKRKVADQVANVYKINDALTNKQLTNIATFNSNLIKGRNYLIEQTNYNPQSTYETIVITASVASQANKTFGVQLTTDQMKKLMMSSQETVLDMTKYEYNLLEEQLNLGVNETDVENAKFEILSKISLENKDLGGIITIGVNENMMANTVYDEDATNNEKLQAQNRVESVFYTRGQAVALKGETINEAQFAILQELGAVKGDFNFDIGLYLGIAICVFIIFLVFYFYIYFFNNTILTDLKKFILCNSIIVISITLCYIAMNFRDYLVPVALGGMLCATLLNRGTAFFANITICGIVGLTRYSSWSYFALFVFMISGFIGILIIDKNKTKVGIFWAGLAIAAVSFFLNTGFTFVAEKGVAISFAPAIDSILNAGVATILCVGLTLLLENLFGVLTTSLLLELGNTEQHLLKELASKAPGTYNHSVIVATLAEEAAREIEANYLLTRVGAYYHDIGKLRRPIYFKENQTGGNIHDTLEPLKSANILTSHVVDGYRMGLKAGLPKQICDIILQHHGTTVTKFFYDKAIEQGIEVDLDDFRYKGPKPVAKETAIIMMADALEAVMRVKYKDDPSVIEPIVKEIIEQKIHDGQLECCSISFKELEQIKSSFVRTFRGIYHTRIAYKEEDQTN